jgi:drug/metabolite transporter (DMT)-like permease
VLRPRVFLALATVQVVFGVHYFVAKLILESLPPRAWAALRILGAAVVLSLLALALGRRPVRRAADLARLALYALCGVVANQLLFIEGLARTTPAHSAVINSLIPVWTLVLSLVAGRERPSRDRVAAIAVSLGSVLVLLGVEDLRFENALVVGDLLTLANGLSFATFLVLSHDFLRRHDPLAATAALFGFGALGILPIGAGPLAAVDLVALPPLVWGLVAYAVLFATVLAYFLNYYALRHTDSSMVALFIYMQPPIATALSMAFLHERPAPRFWVAAAGVFLGVFLAVRGRRGGAPS